MSNGNPDTPKRKRPKPQPLEWYLAKAKALAPIIPAIKSHRLDKRKKKLLPWEKGLIRKYVNVTAYENRLIPVSKQQAKKLHGMLYAPGVQAIKLDNTGHVTNLRVVNRNMFLTTNGRVWLYWKLDDFSTAGMAKAGHKAFKNIKSAFPIEKIAQLAERAFKYPKVKAVHLWTVNGRVGEPHMDLTAFMYWLAGEWRHYEDTDKWVRGLAIRLTN